MSTHGETPEQRRISGFEPENPPANHGNDMGPSATATAQDINPLAQQCRGLFRQYLATKRVYSKQVGECQHRFLAWASFLGVFALEGASLDSRLRRKPEIKELILLMLRVLERNLKRGIASIGSHDEKEEDDTTPTGDPMTDGAVYGMTGSIDRLHSLAAAIRHPQRSNEVERVQVFARKQAPDSFFDVIVAMIGYHHPEAERRLVVQLAKSIVYRRNRLLWDLRHARKLATETELQQQAAGPASQAPRDAKTPSQQGVAHLPKSGPALSSTVFTERHVAEPESAGLMLQIPNAEVARRPESVRSVNPPPTVLCPAPPQLESSQHEARCDYCPYPIPASIVRDKAKWEEHFFADLRPYACISEECGNFPPSFKTMREWKSHMDAKHGHEWPRYVHRTKWQCFSCVIEKTGEKDGESVSEKRTFDSEVLLINHLSENHPERAGGPELNEAVAASKVLDPSKEGECPICGPPPWDERGKVSEKAASVDDSADDLYRHIAADLRYLATYSIRWWDDDTKRPDASLEVGSDSGKVILSFGRDAKSSMDNQSSDITDADADFDAFEDALRKAHGKRARPLARRVLLKEFSLAQDPFTGSSKPFLPHGYLRNLLSKEIVAEELTGLSPNSQEDLQLFSFVVLHAKKVFAITVMTGLSGPNLVQAMRLFERCDFNDRSLPAPITLRNSYGPLPEPFHKEPWKRDRTSAFFDVQWQFLVPVFYPNKFRYDLDPHCILPFTSIHTNFMVRYPFSGGHKVTIHESHSKYQDKKMQEVIVRTIRSGQEWWEIIWNDQAMALDDMRKLNHPHSIPQTGAISAGDRQYLISQWADGGNLLDFWRDFEVQDLSPEYINEVLVQLRGLADALHSLHSLGFVHGNLKPENILRFQDGTHTGTLKISDMDIAWVERKSRTLIPLTSRIIRYQPPEARIPKFSPLRLSDIWAMGCIILEWMTCLVYSYNELAEVSQRDGSASRNWQFFGTSPGELRRQTCQVHPSVMASMDRLAGDPKLSGSNALRDLLHLVRTRLLVVPVRSGNSGDDWTLGVPIIVTSEDGIQHRATAAEFRHIMDQILDKAKKDESYLCPGKIRQAVRDDVPMRMMSQPVSPEGRATTPHKLLSDQMWKFTVDNQFAGDVIASIGLGALAPKLPRSTRLCARCQALDLAKLDFDDTSASLGLTASDCDFCGLLLGICEKSRIRRVRFRTIGSKIVMNETYPPVLSIFRSAGKCRDTESASAIARLHEGRRLILQEPRTAKSIQIGFPVLPESGSQTHFAVMRQWLKSCDDQHPKCRRTDAVERMPTRLLDVMESASPIIRLYETRPGDSDRYLALSNTWGDGRDARPPCTFTTNFKAFKQGIAISSLPATYGDAIMTTRALGVRYLWIDSLCIIQDSHWDFEEEVKHVGDIFNFAYCVIAATRARDANDGFLRSRPRREYVQFDQDAEAGQAVYVSPCIDDFDQDVLQSQLHQRAWRLQERALARRTIFFAERQTYWECGGGVRCETLTKMDSDFGAALGDPNYPEYIMHNPRGIAFTFIEGVYSMYTRLGLMSIRDRPSAIAGLEKRLIKAFSGRGAYGIFDDPSSTGLFHRSLLWQRAAVEASMKRIDFQDSRAIPSWSWMAYMGAISYMDYSVDDVDWDDTVRSPWSQAILSAVEENTGLDITAIAREFDLAAHWHDDPGFMIRLDIPDRVEEQTLKCVVVGRDKKSFVDSAERRHYVLYVVPVAEKSNLYERAGMGYLPGRCIRLGESDGQLVFVR